MLTVVKDALEQYRLIRSLEYVIDNARFHIFSYWLRNEYIRGGYPSFIRVQNL